MLRRKVSFVIFSIILAVYIENSLQWPLQDDFMDIRPFQDDFMDTSASDRKEKAVYKAGDIKEQVPLTMDQLKKKLKESGVFDWNQEGLDAQEKKELGKLHDAVEIMTSSRMRQPSNVQTVFSSLRLVERAVKKLLKEGQLSESLAEKFNWDKLITRSRRAKPLYKIDSQSGMRIFDMGMGMGTHLHNLE